MFTVGNSKTIVFTGVGVSSNDFAKWVDKTVDLYKPYGCDAPGKAIVATAQGTSHDQANNALSLAFVSPVSVDAVFNFLPSATGGPWYLCYKIGSEPYHLFEEYSVTVNQITGMRPELGGSTAVVDVPKYFVFDGSGVAIGDKVKWVSQSAKYDQDCAVLSAQGTEQTVNGQMIAGGRAQFNFTSNSGGETWKLCYQFGAEKYKLFPEISISVHSLTSVSATAGANSLRLWDSRRSSSCTALESLARTKQNG